MHSILSLFKCGLSDPELANMVFFFAVSAAVYTEGLFKSSGDGQGGRSDSFLDQQFWLYLYGASVATTIHLSGNSTYFVSAFLTDFAAMSPFFKVKSSLFNWPKSILFPPIHGPIFTQSRFFRQYKIKQKLRSGTPKTHVPKLFNSMTQSFPKTLVFIFKRTTVEFK